MFKLDQITLKAKMADNANKIMPMNGHVEFSKTFITNLH